MAKTVFTVKITQTLTVDVGSIPPRAIAELIQEKGNGLLTDNFGVYDIGDVSEEVDEVTFV